MLRMPDDWEGEREWLHGPANLTRPASWMTAVVRYYVRSYQIPPAAVKQKLGISQELRANTGFDGGLSSG
jgi:hypothetical protein